MEFFIPAQRVYLALIAPLCMVNVAYDCSLIKSFSNVKCVYNPNLHQESDPIIGLQEKHQQYSRRRRNSKQQNDFNDKILEMEKGIYFTNNEHDKRLKELEGRLKNILGLNSDSSTAHTKTKLNNTYIDPSNFINTPQNTNLTQRLSFKNKMLSHLHNEYINLRDALQIKTEQLLDVQMKINESEKLFEKYQIDFFNINQHLLKAQNKISILQRENAILKNQLKDRNYHLELSAIKISECDAKRTNQESQLFSLIRSENTLSESLMTCKLMLNSTQTNYDQLKGRHRALKSRHETVRTVLSIREDELIDCYAAKTDTFCGFEDAHLCGFQQPNSTDFFDWEWGKGTTPSFRTGPSSDHTCGTKQGHFMYIEASAKGKGKNAIIYSPLYRGLEQQCLQFYYHMNGDHIGTLNVYANARASVQLSSVWRAWGNQGDIWTMARLAISKQLARAGYQIAFEGITENGYQGDIAIDDVSVTDGQCPSGVVQAVNIALDNSLKAQESKQPVQDRKGNLPYNGPLQVKTRT